MIASYTASPSSPTAFSLSTRNSNVGPSGLPYSAMSLARSNSTSTGSAIIARAARRASCLMLQAASARSPTKSPCESHCLFNSGMRATCPKYHLRISALVLGASVTENRLSWALDILKVNVAVSTVMKHALASNFSVILAASRRSLFPRVPSSLPGPGIFGR